MIMASGIINYNRQGEKHDLDLREGAMKRIFAFSKFGPNKTFCYLKESFQLIHNKLDGSGKHNKVP